MTKRKDWPEESTMTDDEVRAAAISALEFLEGMITRGGHSGPASDLTALAARVRAALFPDG